MTVSNFVFSYNPIGYFTSVPLSSIVTANSFNFQSIGFQVSGAFTPQSQLSVTLNTNEIMTIPLSTFVPHSTNQRIGNLPFLQIGLWIDSLLPGAHNIKFTVIEPNLNVSGSVTVPFTKVLPFNLNIVGGMNLGTKTSEFNINWNATGIKNHPFVVKYYLNNILIETKNLGSGLSNYSDMFSITNTLFNGLPLGSNKATINASIDLGTQYNGYGHMWLNSIIEVPVSFIKAPPTTPVITVNKTEITTSIPIIIPYSVSDPTISHTIDISVYVNGIQKDTQNMTSGTLKNFTFNINPTIFNSMNLGNNVVLIQATNNEGMTTSRSIIIIKIEDDGGGGGGEEVCTCEAGTGLIYRLCSDMLGVLKPTDKVSIVIKRKDNLYSLNVKKIV